MSDHPGGFISGVYNYCDRWCERCRFNDRCRVYFEERRRMAEHERRGEDPDDPDVFMEDVNASLGEAMAMLEAMAAEAGVDLDAEAEPPPERRSPQEHPLHERAERWAARVEVLLNRVRVELPERSEAIVRACEAGGEAAQAEALAALTRLRDAHELLARYRFFLVIKLARAIDSWEEGDERESEMLAGFARDDARGTAKLVHECFGKAAAALWQVAEFDRAWFDQAVPMATEAEAIRKEIDAAFPGHHSFCRPGFDEEP